MVGFSRCLLSSALLLAGTDGARVSRSHNSNYDPSNTKFIAGVPVINYNMAHGGQASLSAIDETKEEEWIVMLHNKVPDSKIQALCQVAKKGCKASGKPDKGGVPYMYVRGTEKDLEEVIKSGGGAVKFVEPDQPIFAIPEVPEEATDGSSLAESQAASWGLDRVGVSKAANQGQGVNIFILDTGVRTTHKDFGSRGRPEADFSSDRAVECNGDVNCAVDRQGHGTHCAGSAAGSTYGVAPKATVHGVKVLGDNGSGSFTAILGAIDLTAASSLRPAVASMSLGGRCSANGCPQFGSVTTAVESATDAGVTIVVAGGNDNMDACGFVPAFTASAITVGSTDSRDRRSSFSNYGTCTDIWAPGSAIRSASNSDDSGSRVLSGTSMACPHVAGGAALILEKNPSFKSEQVIGTLIANSATDYITDLKAGDVNHLLYVGADAPPAVGDVTPRDPAECPFWCVICLFDACQGCC